MAPTLDELTETIGTLSLIFPQFVTKQIAALTDQFTSSIAAIENPLADCGDLNIASLLQGMGQLIAGSVSGSLTQMSPSMLPNAVTSELQGMTPGQIPAPSGNRITDMLNLSSTVAGNSMLMLAFLPEAPYVAAQKICATIVSLTTLKLKNLRCLQKHTVQLANVISILIDRRDVSTGLGQTLATMATQLQTAIAEFNKSRFSTPNGIVFDVKAFDRGRAAIDQVISTMAPAISDPSTVILAATSVLTGNAPLPPSLQTMENALLALHVAPQLISMIQSEVSAINEQTHVINQYLKSLRAVVANYAAAGSSSVLRELRLQAIGSIILKLRDMLDQVGGAISIGKAAQTSAQLLVWNARLQAIKTLAVNIRSEVFSAGSSQGTEDATRLGKAYDSLIAALASINSQHVIAAVDDITDLVRLCSGVATLGQSILNQIDNEEVVPLSSMRTFQLLVCQAASNSKNRIAESGVATQQLQDACSAMLSVTMPGLATFEKISTSMNQLGMDRAQDLLNSGAFSELLALDLDDMSYLGMAIGAMTQAMNTITDQGFQNQLGTITDDLVAMRTDKLLTASDNLEFAGLRQIQQVEDAVAALQQSAAVVKSILGYVQGVADQLGAPAVDPGMFPEMLTDIDHLAIGGGGRLAGDVWKVTTGNVAPTC